MFCGFTLLAISPIFLTHGQRTRGLNRVLACVNYLMLTPCSQISAKQSSVRIFPEPLDMLTACWTTKMVPEVFLPDIYKELEEAIAKHEKSEE